MPSEKQGILIEKSQQKVLPLISGEHRPPLQLETHLRLWPSAATCSLVLAHKSTSSLLNPATHVRRSPASGPMVQMRTARDAKHSSHDIRSCKPFRLHFWRLEAQRRCCVVWMRCRFLGLRDLSLIVFLFSAFPRSALLKIPSTWPFFSHPFLYLRRRSVCEESSAALSSLMYSVIWTS